MNAKQRLSQLGLDAEFIEKYLPEQLTLSYHDGVLFVCEKQNSNTHVFVDFLSGQLAYRASRHTGGEHLVKACKIKSQDVTTVLDATCGMGKDSFLLLKAGFKVTATENNPVIQALLMDGIERLSQDKQSGSFRLLLQDAETVMNESYFDVIYLDPMFPEKMKTAKAKKDMQLFQRIHQNAEDNAEQLLNTALNSQCKRVVIKRPIKSGPLISQKPTFQIVGKTCRFEAFQLQ